MPRPSKATRRQPQAQSHGRQGAERLRDATNWSGGTAPATGVNEVQTVTITGTPSGGDFTLTFMCSTTAAIAFDATSATVQTRLQALSSIGSGNVSVSGSAGGPYTVTFIETLGLQNVSAMTANGGGLTGGSAPDVAIADDAGVTGDAIVFTNNSIDCLYNLSQTALDPSGVTVEMSYTGKLGLPRRNIAGYAEYREDYLNLGGATTLKKGVGSGSGTGRCKIKTGAVVCTATVDGTGTPIENGVEAFLWAGTHASNSMVVNKGSVGGGHLPRRVGRAQWRLPHGLQDEPGVGRPGPHVQHDAGHDHPEEWRPADPGHHDVYRAHADRRRDVDRGDNDPQRQPDRAG